MTKSINRTLLFLFTFLFCITAVKALTEDYTNLLINDDFNYTDSFLNHDWTHFSNTAAGSPSVPVNGTYGMNVSSWGGGSGSRSLSIRDTIKNLSFWNADSAMISFDFLDMGSTMPNTVFRVSLCNNSDSVDSMECFTTYIGYSNNGAISTRLTTVGAENCSFPYDKGIWNHLTVRFGFASQLYTIYLNGNPICSNLHHMFGIYSFNASRIRLRQDVDNGHAIQAFIDTFRYGEGNVSQTSCDYPLIFCDTFEYSSPMLLNNWYIYDSALTLNYGFSPIEGQLKLIDNTYKRSNHYTGAFHSSYQAEETTTYTLSSFAPVFASQFKISPKSGNFMYKADKRSSSLSGYKIKGIGNASNSFNVTYFNATAGEYSVLCEYCMNNGSTYSMKIISYFSQRNNFNFNSSITEDKIEVYVDGDLIGTIPSFIDTSIDALGDYDFVKESSDKFEIDDYYVMVGTDILVPTIENYYKDFFIPPDNVTISATAASGEISDIIKGMYCQVGLCSWASRLIFALFLIFILNLIFIMMQFTYRFSISPIIYAVFDFFLILLLTYLKLIPVWITIVIAVIVAGIAALAVKMGIASE